MPGRSARPSAERLHLVVEQRAAEAHGKPAPRGELALGPFVLIVAAGRRTSNSTFTSRLSGGTVFAAIVGVRPVIDVMPLCGTAGSAKRRIRTIAQLPKLSRKTRPIGPGIASERMEPSGGRKVLGYRGWADKQGCPEGKLCLDSLDADFRPSRRKASRIRERNLPLLVEFQIIERAWNVERQQQASGTRVRGE